MGRKKEATSATYPVRISQSALQHVDEITGYIAFIECEPNRAIKVGDALHATFDKIAMNPFAFHECPEIATTSKMYRRAVCYSWSVIYKIQATGILILGVIHQSRRPAAYKSLRKVK